jgi:hypothetical protein
MRNEMGSSRRNPEQHCQGQSDAPSPKIDVCRQMSKSESLREAQVGGCSDEQQAKERNEEKVKKRNEAIIHMMGEECGKRLIQLPHEIQDIIVEKAMANALAANLSDVKKYKDSCGQNVAIDFVEEKADKSLAPRVVEQLANLPDDFQLKMLSVISRWGDQSAVPKLVKKLADSDFDNEVCGAIIGVIGKLGGRSELNRALDRKKIGWWWLDEIKSVEEMLKKPSGGQELARELRSDQIGQKKGEMIAGVLGMLGDVSVARE